jgi:hypothetical protein
MFRQVSLNWVKREKGNSPWCEVLHCMVCVHFHLNALAWNIFQGLERIELLPSGLISLTFRSRRVAPKF